jgi:hypothetical protein
MGHSSIQITVDVYGHLVPAATAPRSIAWTHTPMLQTACKRPHSGRAPSAKIAKLLRNLASLTFASWNRIHDWLIRLGAVQQTG